jgi:hypothetical protein
VSAEDVYSSTHVKSELQEAELSGEEDLSSSGGSRGKTLNRAQRSSTRVAQVELDFLSTAVHANVQTTCLSSHVIVFTVQMRLCSTC